jgi:hypothetical protein
MVLNRRLDVSATGKYTSDEGSSLEDNINDCPKERDEPVMMEMKIKAVFMIVCL